MPKSGACQKVFTDLKDQIVAANSVQLDGISGATFTSKGLFAAVEDAAKKAGVTLGQADKRLSKLRSRICRRMLPMTS